MKIWEICI